MSVNALIFTELMDTNLGFGRAIGAYRIANEIRKSGYTCQVVDLFTEFSEEEMGKIMSTFIGSDTLIVGFSSTFFMYSDERLDRFQKSVYGKETQLPGNRLITLNYPYHRDKMELWFDKMKKINPKLKIVLGGSKTNNMMGQCDAYAIGYCDQAIVDYMKFLEGKNPFFQFERINDFQIVFDGEKCTGKFDFSTSIVDWHQTDHLMYGEAVPIETARGCIFKCKFCRFPLNGKKSLDYIKSDAVLKDEFLKNYYEYGITRYTYSDDTHNDSIEKLQRLHKIVTSLPFELEFATCLRHDLIYTHKETAALLRESGLRSAVFGIETLNHKSGKAIGKGLHPEKTKELLYWLKEDVWKDEVAIKSGFIIGLPYDTPDTIDKWSKWLLDPNCPIDLCRFEPLGIDDPKNKARIWSSEFEISAEKYGYVLGENGDWSNDHFSRTSAFSMARELNNINITTNRLRCAGNFVITLSNLGFIPKELIYMSEQSIADKVQIERIKYIDGYKGRLLNYIRTQ